MSWDSDSDSDMASGSDAHSDWLNEEESSTLRNRGRKRQRSGRSRRSSSKEHKRLSFSPHNSHSKRPTRSLTVPQEQGESPPQKNELPVTCGEKKGILHKDRFKKGEACILFDDDQWFTPTQFEKVGGKERNKNWKISIFWNEIQLQTLIQDDFLPCPSFRQKPSRNKEPEIKKRTIRSRRNTNHGKDSSSESNDSTDDDDDDDDDDCFTVTCSKGKGVLHVSRFATGDHGKCIITQDGWLTPNDFLNQNKTSGHWKQDIKNNNGEPLGKLVKKRVLKNKKCFKCKGNENLVFCSTCPLAFHDHCHKPALTDKDKLSHHWTCFFCNKSAPEKDREQQLRKVDDRQTVDLSIFDLPSLPVSCGSVSGFLYKSRFAGSGSKSIRTEERWFTPEEFVNQVLPLKDRCWMTDVLCNGKPLNYLLKKKILDIHLSSCTCHLCNLKTNWKQNKDDVCYICNGEEHLVHCDNCPRAFHPLCHVPTLQEDKPGKEWICTFCVIKTNQRSHMSRKDPLSRPFSESQHCDYLLLQLYKLDTEHVFSLDPAETVLGYSNVIFNSMWLNRVKTKLQKNKYRRVEQFVCDIHLIFNNCQTFNKDNRYGVLGAKMKKRFDEEFNTIFKIQ